MKKQTTKKGWLLGLLVALMMLVGVSPAMAGTYSYLGSLCDGLEIGGVMYTTDTAGKLYADNSLVSWESELHFSNTPTPWTENGASFTFDSGSDLSGEWTSNYDVTFFIVKGSNCGTAGGYAALFAWSSGDKQKSSFDLDDYLEANASAISNIRLYSTDGSTAPIPSAVWLLGSGLSALMVARRRRKKA